LTGCAPNAPQKYSDSFTGSFDTVIQIIAYTDSEADFTAWFEQARLRFLELHRLFDIYHTYPDLNNLATVNAMAGVAPVGQSGTARLIRFSLETDKLSPGRSTSRWGLCWRSGTITAPGPSRTWKRPSRTRPSWKMPPVVRPDKVIVDDAAGTLYLADAGMRLDVGAVAKGYATERVARELIEAGMVSGIISAGGSNVRLIGKPLDDRDTWQIGLQNPDGNPLIPDDPSLDVILANDQSIVTSGDYQRYYEYEGQVYHHLIDSRTLQPARHYRAVTVMTPDSALADYLSTALFLLPYEESRQLADSLPDCEVLWFS
jgi:thiamine biosynthesis lipoprotein